ncbi:hypothetical protein KBX29_09805 [Corynebacterium sp. CCUG 18816]|uniref:hypothetical protein n=1 Tax=Corynebacterium pseudogenitalium TaxID=38303 RepID=UPI00210874D6|nr:hypothetical protein [Corynebacterium pseudogenitalium]MCQ4617117.1 hypothetical protein [Corynebacterium pseudogenitalium]
MNVFGRRIVRWQEGRCVKQPHQRTPPVTLGKILLDAPSALLRIGHGDEDREDHRNDGNEDKSDKTVANGAGDFLTVRRYERCGDETESDCD